MPFPVATLALALQPYCLVLDSAKVEQKICWEGEQKWVRSFLGVDLIHLREQKKWRILNHSKKEWFELADSTLAEIAQKKKLSLELLTGVQKKHSTEQVIPMPKLSPCNFGQCFSVPTKNSEKFADIESFKEKIAPSLYPLRRISQEMQVLYMNPALTQMWSDSLQKTHLGLLVSQKSGWILKKWPEKMNAKKLKIEIPQGYKKSSTLWATQSLNQCKGDQK
jgi:hypothetical protein